MLDVKRKTLERQLNRYKNSELHGRLMVAADHIDPKRKQMIVAQVKGDIDALADLRTLVLMQRARIRKMFAREKEMQMPSSGLRREIETHARLVHRLSELEFDLRLKRRAPRTAKLEGEFDVRHSETAQRYLEEIEVSRSVAEATRQALAVIGSAAEGERDQ